MYLKEANIDDDDDDDDDIDDDDDGVYSHPTPLLPSPLQRFTASQTTTIYQEIKG